MLRIMIFVIALGSSASALATNYQDKVLVPNKPVTKHVLPIVNLLNEANDLNLRSFIKNSLSADWQVQMAQSVEYLQLLNASYGELTFHAYRTYETPLAANEIVAILYSERTESWLALTLIGDQQQIDVFDLSPAKRPSNVPALPSNNRQSAVSYLTDYMNRMENNDVFSGAVLLAKEGDIWLQQAFGLANRRTEQANTLDTQFNLASVSKLFTAVAIAKLVEAGKLSFQDKIVQYLDASWLAPKSANNITIEQLLTHTSGLGNSALAVDKLNRSTLEQYKTLDGFRHLIKQERLMFEPGTGYAYSNTGVFLLGVIIEQVSGQSYFDFVQQHIFNKVGMRQTSFQLQPHSGSNQAIGYEKLITDKGTWLDNLDMKILPANPSGGASSTIGDLHKFANALLQGTLLNPPLSQQVISFYQLPGMQNLNHAGLDYGIGTNLDIFLDSKLIAITLANRTNGASPIAAKIFNAVQNIKD